MSFFILFFFSRFYLLFIIDCVKSLRSAFFCVKMVSKDNIHPTAILFYFILFFLGGLKGVENWPMFSVSKHRNLSGGKKDNILALPLSIAHWLSQRFCISCQINTKLMM